MQAYLDLLDRVLKNGKRHENRTGVISYRVLGGVFEHDMTQGFPILTTKEMRLPSIAGEMIGFIRGVTTVKEFNELGTKVWDAFAGEHSQWASNPNYKDTNNLGRIYGAQWRNWRTADGQVIDQLADAVQGIIDDPDSRRLIVTAWNPGELKQMALPPCHKDFQLVPDKESNTLSLVWTQRSCDMFLGIPYNIAGYGLLLYIIARATGYRPGSLVGLLSDMHLYENQLVAAKEQLTRTPSWDRPRLYIKDSTTAKVNYVHPMDFINTVDPSNFELFNYYPQGPLRVPVVL